MITIVLANVISSALTRCNNGWNARRTYESKTNVERLLEEVNVIKVPFNSGPESIFKGDNRCVLVFSILLKQNRGNLIYVFQSAEIIDEHLNNPDYNRQKLADKLNLYKIADIDTIIKQFERKKWAFCPAHL